MGISFTTLHFFLQITQVVLEKIFLNNRNNNRKGISYLPYLASAFLQFKQSLCRTTSISCLK